MNSSTRLSLTMGLGIAALAAGCALTSKSDSVILRYFTPERVSVRTPPPAPPAAASSAGPGLQLHLGRVVTVTYLRERIAFRDSDYEIGFYDDLRWTERPDAYVKRAMVRALFEDQPIKQIVSGSGPTLDVEVTAFEELRIPRHAARVEITWRLYDAFSVLAQKTVLVERPIAEPPSTINASAVATAMSEALSLAVKDAVAGVVVALPPSPVPEPPVEIIKGTIELRKPGRP